MRAEFTPTLDELVDAHILGRTRGGIGRLWCWSGCLVTATVVGLVAAAVARPGWTWSGVIFTVTAVATAIAYPHLAVRLALRSIRRDVIRQFGRTPSAVDLETTERGVWIARDGVQTLYEWPFMRGVDSEGGRLLIFLRDANAIVVPARACPTWDEMAEWIEACRRFAADAMRTGEAELVADAA